MSTTEKKVYKILLVDDVKSICNSLRRELTILVRNQKDFTFKIIDIQDPTIAMNVLREGKFDLLFSDIRMPYLTGDKLIHEVRKEFQNLPIIVITGFATKESIISIYQTDKSIAILGKPWDSERLVQVISQCLNVTFVNEIEKLDEKDIKKS
jgi:DNA-binding NtrC family response regulator